MATRIKKSEVKEGEGNIFPSEGEHGIAVFRESSNTFTVLSADCPHAHCDVEWADHDKTWFCPCHGSKFDDRGKLISGPAKKDLAKIPVKDEGEELVADYDGSELHD